MLTTTTATIAGHDTRVIQAPGDGSAPTLLFLHGYSDSAGGWRRVQRRLAEMGIGSVAVDQPSHGECTPLDDTAPVIPQFVAFAADAAKQAAGGAPVIVVGNSLGGAHALLLAQHHPDLVSGVVAISPASFDHPDYFRILNEDSRAGNRLRSRAKTSGDRDEQTETTLDTRGKLVRRVVMTGGFRAVAFARPWRAPSGFVEEWRQQWRDPARRAALRSLVPRIRDEYIEVDPIDLAAVPHPVLALWGTQDRLVKVSSRRTLEAGLADLEFIELPGIGHMPQQEAPGRTTKHLHRFATRVPMRG